MTQQLTVTGKPVFTEALPALTTSSPGHPDSWNPQYQALLGNDHFLREAIAAVGQGLAGFEDRLEGVEITSSEALDRAMRLNWLYGSSRMALELFTPAWSLRDMDAIAVTSAVAGDDSLDVESTTSLQVGQEYILAGANGFETVKVSQILTARRIRIAGVLAATYDAQATLARTNWGVTLGEAAAADGSVYFSKPINLAGTLGNHLVVIRRTASVAKLRLFYIDANNPAWKEATLLQQVATGVTDTGMADYTFQVPATGDFRLKVLVTGGAIKLRHLAAVTGKPTTLSAAGITDAYTKAETDAGLASVPRTRVITTPTISGSTSVTPGTNFTLTAISASRLTGATVASFDWTKPDGSKVNTVASNSAASLTLQVSGAIGDTRTLQVEAIDSDGNRSAARTVVISITSNNAPSMDKFASTVPASVNSGTTQNVAFSGATDADGDALTYQIDAGTNGFGFSKLSGIAAGESVAMTAPGTTAPTETRSFTVYAVDAKGARTPATVSLVVFGQTVWEFKTPGSANWTAPVTGRYKVTEYGAGSSGYYAQNAVSNAAGGAGGGYADKVMAIAAGATATVQVGAGGVPSAGSPQVAGGTTSFAVSGGTSVTATGGSGPSSPGTGSGGDNNRTGGMGAAGSYPGAGAGNDAGGGGGGAGPDRNGGAGSNRNAGTNGGGLSGNGGVGGYYTQAGASSMKGGDFGGGGGGCNYGGDPSFCAGGNGYLKIEYLGA